MCLALPAGCEWFRPEPPPCPGLGLLIMSDGDEVWELCAKCHTVKVTNDPSFGGKLIEIGKKERP
jgi:hypothetical protein